MSHVEAGQIWNIEEGTHGVLGSELMWICVASQWRPIPNMDPQKIRQLHQKMSSHPWWNKVRKHAEEKLHSTKFFAWQDRCRGNFFDQTNRRDARKAVDLLDYLFDPGRGMRWTWAESWEIVFCQ